MYVGQDHGLLGVMRTQKDVPVPVLTKHYRLDKVISYECSLIVKMDSVHRRRFTEKVENGSFSRFSLPTVTDYRQMVEVHPYPLNPTTPHPHSLSLFNFCFVRKRNSVII